ncbi:MAG: DUF2807 domain-containing protein [Myxococcota bacterium]|jgi:hypothetical protein|nr:DUF2807 domain-containing protein [Myxococcota bacterium]
MKTSTCTYSLILLAACLGSACGLPTVPGSGKIVTQDRAVNGFSRIALCGQGQLILVQGETDAVKIEADDNLLPDIVSEAQAGTLKIGLGCSGAMKNYRPSRRPTYYVTLKTVQGLSVSGSGSLTAAALNADALELQVSGSGDLNVGALNSNTTEVRISGSGEIALAALVARALRTDISGSGTVKVAGKVPAQQITISGSGTYAAPDAMGQTATVRISGSGESTVWATESLEAIISGSGTLRYYGQPRLTQTNSGSPTIEALGAHP